MGVESILGLNMNEVEDIRNGILPPRIDMGAWRPCGENEEVHAKFTRVVGEITLVPARLYGATPENNTNLVGVIIMEESTQAPTDQLIEESKILVY